MGASEKVSLREQSCGWVSVCPHPHCGSAVFLLCEDSPQHRQAALPGSEMGCGASVQPPRGRRAVGWAWSAEHHGV